MIAQPELLTTEAFEQFIALPENRERLFELVNGEIVEKVPTRGHAVVANNFGTEFNNYLDVNDIGQAGVEARHRPTGDDTNDRIPDVSLVLGNRPVEMEGVADYIPDVCVEIQSPGDSPKKLQAKADFYLQHGAKLVILVYMPKRLLEVRTPNETTFLTEADTLEGGEVLPGFSVQVSRLFRRV